jgi:DNA-3-methyladenine glycosylase I
METQVDGDVLDLGDDGRLRCWWSGSTAEYRSYHDDEWGRPVTDDRRLFEKLCLEGFQAGLSWLTILRKRENFRAAFDQFDFTVVAGYDERDVERLLADAGIVRHRGKIESTINNAQRTVELVEDGSSLRELLWGFAPDPSSRPSDLTRELLMQSATSPESVALSKHLKRAGWSFVGPTTMYALMQAMGLVNDHQSACHVRGAVERDRRPHFA